MDKKKLLNDKNNEHSVNLSFPFKIHSKREKANKVEKFNKLIVSKLAKSNFLNSLNHKIIEIFKDDVKELKTEIYLIKNDKLSEKLSSKYIKYVQTVFSKVTLVNNLLMDLELTIIFLNNFNSFKNRKFKIEEIAYYKYHFENYYIRISSVLDFISHLVNCIYQLGYNNHICNIQNLIENNNIKNSEASKALSNIKKYLDKYRSVRNKIVHSGENELKIIGLLEDLTIEFSFLNDNSKNDIFLKWKKSDSIEKKNLIISECNFMINEYLIITDLYIKLLASMKTVFEEQCKLYR